MRELLTKDQNNVPNNRIHYYIVNYKSSHLLPRVSEWVERLWEAYEYTLRLFFDKTGMWRFFRKKIVNYLRPKKQDKMIAVNGSNDAGNPAIPVVLWNALVADSEPLKSVGCGKTMPRGVLVSTTKRWYIRHAIHFILQVKPCPTHIFNYQ